VAQAKAAQAEQAIAPVQAPAPQPQQPAAPIQKPANAAPAPWSQEHVRSFEPLFLVCFDSNLSQQVSGKATLADIQAEEERRRLHEQVMAQQAQAILDQQARAIAEQARAYAAANTVAWGPSKGSGTPSLREIQELELKQQGAEIRPYCCDS
jgi:hypothetical protein